MGGNNKADVGEQISLGMQFVASFLWAIGAILAEPSSTADYLQLFAAVAWCIANFASAWSMYLSGSDSAASSAKTSEKNVELSKV